MCNQEDLISYLYDDMAPADRRAFEAHLAQCAECRAEVAGLRRTRQHLSSWAPPEPEFDFQVVQSAPAARVPRRRFAFVPQWGLAAAAALLVMAGAAAIANLEMRYGPEGFVVRTGWADAPAERLTAPATGTAPVPVVGATPTPASDGDRSSEQLMEAVRVLARRVEELEQSQPAPGVRAAGVTRSGVSVPELRKILAESEARQRVEMALRIEQVWKDFNAARANDFMRVQQAVGPELQRQQRMLENVMYRTTQK
jgi:hypothetical protein